MGITTPTDFLVALGTNSCQTYTDPTEYGYCLDLLADSGFVGQLTDLTNLVLDALQTCASVRSTDGQDYQIVINSPNNGTDRAVTTTTGTIHNVVKRHEKRAFTTDQSHDLTRSMLEAIEDYRSTADAPLLGHLKSSGMQLTRKQTNICSRTGECFQTCPDCRNQQTYCGSQATIITTAVCGSLAAVANAGVAAVAAGACGSACGASGPGAVVCAAFCARAAGGLAATAVGTACAVVRSTICDPLTERCANCNSFNNGVCNSDSTQCCAGETGTQCGAGCCCCPRCFAPGGINCACTAASC